MGREAVMGQEQLAALREEVRAARLAFYRTLGDVSEPAWLPDKEEELPLDAPRWCSILRGEYTWFVTDGLSDPELYAWGEVRRGRGAEVFLELPTVLTLPGEDGARWALEVLKGAVQLFSRRPWNGNEVLPVQLSPRSLPSVCGDVTAGALALLGVKWQDAPQGFELPTGFVSLAALSVLTGGEVVWVQEQPQKREEAIAHVVRFQGSLERDVLANPHWRSRAWSFSGGSPLEPRVAFEPESEDDPPPYENKIHDWLDRQRILARGRLDQALAERARG
ncbi:hypothetical protein P2318_00725 [Myxococcaceae bacterium GXIMD 01537]